MLSPALPPVNKRIRLFPFGRALLGVTVYV
jgi:hypothetical protein